MNKLATVDIKGKDYVLVNERIRAFRELYKDYRLTSDIVSLENGVCVIKATVADENGNVVATGHAYEKEGSTYINKTSYIENCETSAWGRALGNFGIGIDTAIASYEEVANAVAQQTTPEDTKKMQDGQRAFNEMFSADEPKTSRIIQLCKKTNTDLGKIYEKYGVTRLADLAEPQLDEILSVLRKKLVK